MTEFIRIKNIVIRKNNINAFGMSTSLKGNRLFPVMQLFLHDGEKSRTLELVFSDVAEMAQCFTDTTYAVGIDISSEMVLKEANKMWEESNEINKKVLDEQKEK